MIAICFQKAVRDFDLTDGFLRLCGISNAVRPLYLRVAETNAEEFDEIERNEPDKNVFSVNFRDFLWQDFGCRHVHLHVPAIPHEAPEYVLIAVHHSPTAIFTTRP